MKFRAFITAGLIVLASVFAGGWSSQAGPWKAEVGVHAGYTPAAQSTPGKDTFEANCIGCHGPDGSGTDLGKSLKAPDLRSDDVQKVTDDMLAQIISNGQNSMPPFKATLSPEQIQGVIVYIRGFAKKE